MKIAALAPIAWRTPPRYYGPWELVTSLLPEALVARGIDVTLFATLDSVPNAKLEGADQFDLIHNQADFPAHALSSLVDTPIVTTIHGLSSERILPMYVDRSSDLDRAAIRRFVSERFSVDRMADGYVGLYRSILDI